MQSDFVTVIVSKMQTIIFNPYWVYENKIIIENNNTYSRNID